MIYLKQIASQKEWRHKLTIKGTEKDISYGLGILKQTIRFSISYFMSRNFTINLQKVSYRLQLQKYIAMQYLHTAFILI